MSKEYLGRKISFCLIFDFVSKGATFFHTYSWRMSWISSDDHAIEQK